MHWSGKLARSECCHSDLWLQISCLGWGTPHPCGPPEQIPWSGWIGTAVVLGAVQGQVWCLAWHQALWMCLCSSEGSACSLLLPGWPCRKPLQDDQLRIENAQSSWCPVEVWRLVQGRCASCQCRHAWFHLPSQQAEECWPWPLGCSQWQHHRGRSSSRLSLIWNVAWAVQNTTPGPTLWTSWHEVHGHLGVKTPHHTPQEIP